MFPEYNRQASRKLEGQFGPIWALAHKYALLLMFFSLYQKTIGGEKSIKLSEPLLSFLKRNAGKKGGGGLSKEKQKCEGLRQRAKVLQFSSIHGVAKSWTRLRD